MERDLFVSISSSRGFSFQVLNSEVNKLRALGFQSRHREAFHFRSQTGTTAAVQSDVFQSRNRDAFHFRDTIEATAEGDVYFVSISSSRCFSFQGLIASYVASEMMVSIS